MEASYSGKAIEAALKEAKSRLRKQKYKPRSNWILIIEGTRVAVALAGDQEGSEERIEKSYINNY